MTDVLFLIPKFCNCYLLTEINKLIIMHMDKCGKKEQEKQELGKGRCK